jgi:hypothetical protein
VQADDIDSGERHGGRRKQGEHADGGDESANPAVRLAAVRPREDE